MREQLHILGALGIAAMLPTSATARDDLSQNPGWLEEVAEAGSMDPEVLQKRSQAAQEAWRACLKTFADNASLVSSDPSDLVVRVSLAACESERTAGELAWARMVFRSSSFKPTQSRAIEMARESYDAFAKMQEESLLVRVSYNRQIEALRAKGRAH